MQSTSWHSYHIFYRGDRRIIVAKLVLPLVTSLLKDQHVDRFFFLYYPLGGPHLRLRLRPQLGRGPIVDQAFWSASKEFLERWPSPGQFDAELVRQATRAILEHDTAETDSHIYTNNTALAFPFRPEIDRYGGLEALPLSLDFFMITSSQAIDFTLSHYQESRRQQLLPLLAVLAQQAMAFARSVEEVALFAESMTANVTNETIQEKAKAFFAGHRESLCEFLRRACGYIRQALRSPSAALDAPTELYVSAARQFAQAVSSTAASARWQILTSQLHMTANRHGLERAEEAYLGRILALTLGALAKSSDCSLRDMDEALCSGNSVEADAPLTGYLREAEARLQHLLCPGG